MVAWTSLCATGSEDSRQQSVDIVFPFLERIESVAIGKYELVQACNRVQYNV